MSTEIDIEEIMGRILIHIKEVECEKPESIFCQNSVIPKDIQNQCIEKLKTLGLIRQWMSFVELTEKGYVFISDSLKKELKIMVEKPC